MSKSLYDIIEKLQRNEVCEYDELSHAVLVLKSVLNVVNSTLVEAYVSGLPSDLKRELALNVGVCTLYKKALNASPLEFLGDIRKRYFHATD